MYFYPQNDTRMNGVEVYKFGGASVKDASAIRNVSKILKASMHQPLVIVISAMGKTTNGLEAIIKAHYEDQGALPGLHFGYIMKRLHVSLWVTMRMDY